MPLTLIQTPSSAALWTECAGRFLTANAGCHGPAGYPARLWVTHRLHRDLLYKEAENAKIAGWLDPPVHFLSDLPSLFDLRLKPLGVLRRRLVVARLAEEHAQAAGMGWPAGMHHGSTAGIDGLIGNLLAESISVGELERALAQVADDDYTRRRNQWIAGTYRAYMEYLEDDARYDPRSIHGFVAGRVRAGSLPRVLKGASELHIYGLVSTRTRRRLLEALRDQTDVEVFVYLCAEGENGEWNGLNAGTKAIQAPRPPASLVQPAPDGLRELQYVALEIKKLIIRNGVLPDDIAVVVRTGTHDTSRAHEVLERAGIPTTARIRRPLVDVPAIKAVVQLLRAAAQDWPYHPLRQVIESAYFDIDLDLRSIDRIAQERRVSGLDNWARQVNRLHEMAGSDDERRSMMRRGLFEDRLGRDCQALGELIAHVAPLSHPRDLPAWIDLTMQILKPGSLDFRARLCRPAGDHWDVVRLDQQAVEFLYRLLREWRTLARRGPDLDVGAWYRELHVFLRSNEMAVGTPQQTGVHILEAHEAVCVPFAATFVIHANDGEFPRRESSGNIFSDGEQEILFPLGIPVPPYHVRQARERALWRAVTGNARVTVSYRTADANGVPLLPSVMVPAHDPSSEIPRTDFIWSEPFNQPQDDLATVERLRRSAGSGTRTVIPSPNATTVKRAIVNAVAELQRREARPDSSVTPGAPSAWNGHITDPLVLDHLAQRFGPERTWSASQLETYAQCPFVFLLERVLYLTDSAPAEEATTALTVGGAAHDILEGFHRRYDGNLQEGLTDDARVLLWEVVLDVCGARERNHDEWIGMPVLWEVTKRDLVLRLEEYLDVELTKGFKHQRPLRTEIEFGNESPLSLRGVDVLGNVVTLKLRGRIDRIDEDTRNGDLYVIDYKLGGTPSPRGYEDGSVLQVPLYVAAAEQLLGRDVAQGCYRSIRKKTMTAAGIKADDPRARRVLTYAMSIPGRVRAGLFEACATASRGWPDYGPGQDVIRTSATLPNGTNRFDG